MAKHGLPVIMSVLPTAASAFNGLWVTCMENSAQVLTAA